MIDHAKLARLGLDREQKGAEHRGVGALYEGLRDDISVLDGTMLSGEFRGMTLEQLATATVDRQLARGSALEARRAHDHDVARRVAALRIRLAEIQRRAAVIAEELAPMARLVAACEAYANRSA